MPVIHRDGIRISFEDVGSGSPIILTHSFLCSGEMWRGQVPELAMTNRVINVDLRGHGKSGLIESSFDLYDLVDDVVAVLDSLAVERAVWAGLSVGGMISLRAALTVPERVAGLVLLDTHAGAESPFRRLRYGAMRLTVRSLGFGPLLPTLSKMMFGGATRRSKPDLVAEWQDSARSLDVPSMLWFSRCLLRRDSVVGLLSDVDVPTLVMVGEEDMTLAQKYAEEMAAGIAGARLVVIPGAGHLSALEQPEFVTEEMFRFLHALEK
jgi:pimeloyl-ACP methyl ester carboxylesterase